MHHEQGLSTTHEMYLKVLYRLQLQDKVGRVRDMATGLGLRAGTVSAVLKKLEVAGLVVHDHYGTVYLTPSGMRIAECVIRRFEIIKALLIEILGLDTETAEVDACTMEHAVSPATVNRMESLLNLVRTESISMKPIHDRGRSLSICSECEVSGTCQAVAAAEAPTSTPEQN